MAPTMSTLNTPGVATKAKKNPLLTLQGIRYRNRFRETLEPSYNVIFNTRGDKVRMPFNLYVNWHNLNEGVAEIVGHSRPNKFKNNPKYWSFIFKDSEGETHSCNYKMMKIVDKVRLAHYVSANELCSEGDFFGWTACDDALELPSLEQTRAELQDLAGEVMIRRDHLVSLVDDNETKNAKVPSSDVEQSEDK